MSISSTGSQAVHQTSLYSTAGTAPPQAAQTHVGTGNINGQPMTANNASGPASTGPGTLVAGLKSFGKLVATPRWRSLARSATFARLPKSSRPRRAPMPQTSR